MEINSYAIIFRQLKFSPSIDLFNFGQEIFSEKNLFQKFFNFFSFFLQEFLLVFLDVFVRLRENRKYLRTDRIHGTMVHVFRLLSGTAVRSSGPHVIVPSPNLSEK